MPVAVWKKQATPPDIPKLCKPLSSLPMSSNELTSSCSSAFRPNVATDTENRGRFLISLSSGWRPSVPKMWRRLTLESAHRKRLMIPEQSPLHFVFEIGDDSAELGRIDRFANDFVHGQFLVRADVFRRKMT